MASLRAFASCIGCPTNFSVLRDFFGYASAPPWRLAPPDQQASLPQSLSVVTQVKRLKEIHFSLDLVRVGTDANGFLPDVDEQNLDCAVQMARDIYAAIGIGIGRVKRWWAIPLSWNTGYDIIEDDSEAEDLIHEYDAPGGGIDVFFVLVFQGGSAGLAPGKDVDGVVVASREENFLFTARTFSHELGHYFGLAHENDNPTNLMCQSGQPGVTMPGSTQLTYAQLGIMMVTDKIFRAVKQMLPPC